MHVRRVRRSIFRYSGVEEGLGTNPTRGTGPQFTDLSGIGVGDSTWVDAVRNKNSCIGVCFIYLFILFFLWNYLALIRPENSRAACP